MKISPISGDMAIKLGLGVAAAALAWLAWKKVSGVAGDVGTAAGKAVDAVTTAINPADSNNLVNRAVTSVGASITGDSGFSVGGWIYDVTHPSPSIANAPVPVTKTPVASPAYDALGNYMGDY